MDPPQEQGTSEFYREGSGSDQFTLNIHKNKILKTAIRTIRENNYGEMNHDINLFRGVINVTDKHIYRYNTVAEYIDVAFPFITKDNVESSPKILTEWYKKVTNGIYQTTKNMNLEADRWNKARSNLKDHDPLIT